MRINSIKCPECKDIIYSRTRHDLRHCSCGKCFIDGGFDFIRVSGEEAILRILEIKATPKELYDDWNLKRDKYGLIKNKKDRKLIESIKKGIMDLKKGRYVDVKDLDKFFKEL